MVSFDGRQGREFPLEGLIKGVEGLRRTRRLNRRKRRHLASESSLWVRSYCREDEPKGGCLAEQHLRSREPKVGQLTPVGRSIGKTDAMRPGTDQKRPRVMTGVRAALKATRVTRP